MTTTAPSLCRSCHAGCPVTVEMDGASPVKISGNRNSPTFYNFCCRRGQVMTDHINHPDRLLHSMKRQSDGSYAPIPVEQAMDEIAERLKKILDENSPRSVATYIGTYSAPYLLSGQMAGVFTAALGSPMIFASATIDQPGKDIAAAMLGHWQAGPQPFAGADTWLMVGGNPIVTMAGGIPSQNPARRLTDEIKAGMKLIVIDPRRTETAKRAHIHLQAKPGEDAAILAAMIHTIISEELYDSEFVGENVQGLAELRKATQAYTPAYAAQRADVPAEQIAEAARVFARAKRGCAAGATGANMSGHSSLVEYLLQCLNTLCGRFLREGETVANPGVFLPRAKPVAQAANPTPYKDVGEKLRVRGLAQSACGMPTAALADEILMDGEGQVKALFTCGGNPAAAWPDQKKAAEALKKLELLVHIDIKMSATARLADYVIAPKVSFEVPSISLTAERLESFSYHWGFTEPFGMYAPALTDVPEGSDLIEEWELYYGLAQRLGIGLFTVPIASTTAPLREPQDFLMIDMENKPTTEELFALYTSNARISLEEVKKHPDGVLFPEDIPAAPKNPETAGRLDIGNSDMMSELDEVLKEVHEHEGYPFRLICRRMKNAYNSSLRDIPSLSKGAPPYNPAFLHPDDIAQLGLSEGDRIVLESPHGKVSGIVASDPSLRDGLVSMAHAYGGLPDEDSDIAAIGSSTSLLVSTEDSYDRYSGIPRMSCVPVKVSAA